MQLSPLLSSSSFVNSNTEWRVLIYVATNEIMLNVFEGAHLQAVHVTYALW